MWAHKYMDEIACQASGLYLAWFKVTNNMINLVSHKQEAHFRS
jgi:hypothetical protein